MWSWAVTGLLLEHGHMTFLAIFLQCLPFKRNSSRLPMQNSRTKSALYPSLVRLHQSLKAQSRPGRLMPRITCYVCPLDLCNSSLLLFLEFAPLGVQMSQVQLILVLLAPLQQLLQDLQTHFLQSWGRSETITTSTWESQNRLCEHHICVLEKHHCGKNVTSELKCRGGHDSSRSLCSASVGKGCVHVRGLEDGEPIESRQMGNKDELSKQLSKDSSRLTEQK